ncbi:phage regulatory protein, rha family [Chelatococcus sambhunathii]|uniref:Phage regulatory protein, rha family n=1 Tax=Chelatococcus sambhunathii TaxID=363953 RepID=A0ABM9U9P1_9HYPH|nr:Rha family transcriptional regulator [Chelatococcus sambhunathii]CUA90962.1 phage regulatory protein, rha family [Chelatococcus sambhunathii]
MSDITTPKPVLTIREGTTYANSRNVADCFNKQHKHVLRDIRKIAESTGPDLGWFIPVTYTDAKGEEREEYEMTRDGFTILVMGWTGQRAMEFKVLYIHEFNAMEQALKQAQVQLPDFNDPVAAARAWADAQEQKRIAETMAFLAEDRAEEAEHELSSVMSIIGRHTHTVSEVAATLPGVNRNTIKADLARLGYLRQSKSTGKYRPYAQFAHLFYERISSASGRREIFATAEGKKRLALHRSAGELTLKALAGISD